MWIVLYGMHKLYVRNKIKDKNGRQVFLKVEADQEREGRGRKVMEAG